MNTKSDNRTTAIIVGVLFIIGTASGVMSGVVSGSILSDPDHLTLIAANETKVIIGAILVLIMALSLTMVPVLLYPILKKHNEVLAVGAVVFRGALEAVTYIGIVIAMMLLVTVSRGYVAADAAGIAQYELMGGVLRDGSHWFEQMLAIVFSLGALMIYTAFYQSRLIPRWLSAWGIIGGVPYLAVPLLALFGIDVEFLVIPLAVQEMVMALWLIVKGFNPVAEADPVAVESTLRKQYS